MNKNVRNSDSIRNVAVLGLGTMGHGIVQAMAVAGCEVRAYDAAGEARASLIPRIQKNLAQMVAAEWIDEASRPDILGRITICENESEAVSDAEWVTEAVIEDLTVKRDLFQRLEAEV
ncbi:MAG: 3-hydroxybutyryl-CoA dehydrogenase, partial [Planctomycetes bacterium]|nr:3-hydroxybutyryl-CoA dehydrogenase [Planctomycetota bacterium]